MHTREDDEESIVAICRLGDDRGEIGRLARLHMSDYQSTGCEPICLRVSHPSKDFGRGEIEVLQVVGTPVASFQQFNNRAPESIVVVGARVPGLVAVLGVEAGRVAQLLEAASHLLISAPDSADSNRWQPEP